MYPAAAIRFTATLLQPATPVDANWLFLRLPAAASNALPTPSMVSVTGTFAGQPLQAPLQPDGQGGHWLKVDRALQQASGVSTGQTAVLEIAPLAEGPEPLVPDDLHAALAARPAAHVTWDALTAVARRGATGSSGLFPATRPKHRASASRLRATCWPRESGGRAASIVPACTAIRLRHPRRKRAEATRMVLDVPLYMRRNAYMRHTSAHLYSGAVPPKRS
jgi:hypothetical protein